ncbi:MAG: hypothetical protein ACFFDT_34145 [Candidatus Hodarchaeota archaeon]
MLNSSENITLRYFFTQEDYYVEFEVQWHITITEIDYFKKYTTALIENFWRNLFGVFIAFALMFILDRIFNECTLSSHILYLYQTTLLSLFFSEDEAKHSPVLFL